MTQGALDHLIILPILLPLLCGALMVPVNESRHRLKFTLNAASVIGLILIALVLLQRADGDYWPGGVGVYLAANWAAPFGIALVADRLSAMMLLLTAVLAGCSLLYSSLRWSRIGVHFHSLFQFLLMGINGAFLTHDLFNLFVFFEVMLAASYGLLLHGYTAALLRAGMQYIAINLVASLLFLIGAALIYGAAGTLNMADLAARMPFIEGQDLTLLKVGASVLALAFLTKSAMWPLGFWLPTTYAAASPPVAAMLVLMTKIGAYAILRIWLLAFTDGGQPLEGFGFDVLMWGGIATLVFGAAGLLATDSPGRAAGYAAVISSGTLLAVIGFGHPVVVSAALYYLVSSTLAVGAFMLLIELMERIRTPGAAVLALSMEAFAIDETPEEPVGVGIPGTLAILGLSFAGCALIITGLPPLSGFVAKFSLFHTLLDAQATGASATSAWTLIALIVLSGFGAIVALMRLGVRTFWVSGVVTSPSLRLTEIAPVSLLLVLCVLLATQAGPVFAFLQRANADLHDASRYTSSVLEKHPIPGPVTGGAQ